MQEGRSRRLLLCQPCQPVEPKLEGISIEDQQMVLIAMRIKAILTEEEV